MTSNISIYIRVFVYLCMYVHIYMFVCLYAQYKHVNSVMSVYKATRNITVQKKMSYAFYYEKYNLKSRK